LNLSYFISKRIAAASQGGFSSTIHKIAVVTIAVGLGAAIVSFLIMRGFQETIKNKIYSFSAHLVVTKFTMNNSTEEQPFFYNIDLFNHPEKFPMITHLQEYSHKPGLIKTPDEALGVIFKGVGMSFDTTKFAENMVEGHFITFPDTAYSNQVVVSRIIANKLDLQIGDRIIVHFFQNPPRFRRLEVKGIYETNLSEYYDTKIILGDLRLVQRLNEWADSVAGGIQVYIKDPANADEALVAIGESMDYDLYIEKTSDTFGTVFEWLGLVNRQVVILLGIILIVVCVNMISVVLILVMERVQMVGMLKALGARDGTIRSVFIYSGIRLVFRGLIYGNIIGLGVCFLQDRYKFLKLNAHDYYMSYVPVGWSVETVLTLNLLIFIVVTVVLLLPTAIVTRIRPISAIRFD
jgi:lipoprotein-releasing system permease protein